MQISGNYLPAPSTSSSHQELADRQNAAQRQADSGHRNRQQTIEYVVEGEILEEATYQQHSNPYSQSVDPANQAAIASYVDSTTSVARQGRLVDVFI